MSKNQQNNDADYILKQVQELKNILNNSNNKKLNDNEKSFDKKQFINDSLLNKNSNSNFSQNNISIEKNQKHNFEINNTNNNKGNVQNNKIKFILENLENQVNLLLSENNRLRQEKLKALADLENYKKMLNQEFDEFKKYSIVSFVKNLLPALDNFERALLVQNVSESAKNFLTGFEFINKNIKDVFYKNGIIEIPVKIGDEYNSHIHEAIEIIETKQHKPGTIIKILSKGYKLHDRVIKPVTVNIEK